MPGMTQLSPYIGTRVHLRVHPLAVRETGVLGIEGERLTISTLPGFFVPIGGMTAYVRGQVEPEPIGMADLSLADEERLIEIWASGSPALP